MMFKQAIADELQVPPEDLDVAIVYEVTGTVKLYPGSDVSDKLDDVEESIAEVLGVHVKDVVVEFDPVTGVVSYTVDTASVGDAESLQDIINDSDFRDSLDEEIQENIPETGVVTVDVDPEIDVEIVVTSVVDETIIDVPQAVEAIEQLPILNDFTTVVQGNCCNCDFAGHLFAHTCITLWNIYLIFQILLIIFSSFRQTEFYR